MSDIIADAIRDYLGERCSDFDPGCLCCRAWAEYDEIASLRADNERLRAALEKAKTALAPLATRFLYPDDIGADYAADLRAEDEWNEATNEAALDDVWIARGDIRRARAALEGK